MIKATIGYPFTEGARFDHDYYQNSHLPMVKATLSPRLRRLAVDRGLVGGEPGSNPPYIIVGHLYFDSLESMTEAYTDDARTKIFNDIPNFTDIHPVLMISEVVIDEV
ncbi:EthD family reductase [Streptomyces sp. NPDC046909]|uniref:EthD family reductase n=1 Tax=Streptomyces sp. NPDC046909 TaxID=3155617 RepID=UPI003401FA1B